VSASSLSSQVFICPFCTDVGLINAVNSSISVSEGAEHIFSISYLYSFLSAMLVYVVTSKLWPARESYPEKNVHSDDVGYAEADTNRRYSHV
jgi:cytosine/uracil/thiamine/allantoin permease